MIVTIYHQGHHEFEVSVKIDPTIFNDTPMSVNIPNKIGPDKIINTELDAQNDIQENIKLQNLFYLVS